MKLSKWGIAGVSALTLIVVGSGAVVARTMQNATEGVRDFRAMGFAGILGPGIGRQLNLSSDQKQQIHQIVAADRAGFVPLAADAHTTAEALRSAVRKDPNSPDLQALATSQADADLALIAAAQKTQAKIAAILTPAQLATAQQLFDARIGELQAHLTDGNGPGVAMLSKLGDRLGLSDTQKAQAKEIVVGARTTVQPSVAQLITSLKASEDSIPGGTFDPAAAGSNAQQSEGPLATVVLTGAKTRAQLMAILTPDQKAQLAQWMGGHHRHHSETPA